MTGEEAIERIQIHLAYMGQYEAPKTKAALDMAISALREQEERSNSSQKCNSWISVEEGLPDDSFLEKEIIVCILNRFGERNVYTKKFWGVNSALWNSDITHWMPLPEPPKESEA